MMRYTLTFLEQDYEALRAHLEAGGENEAAAYLICRLAVTSVETRFLVRSVIAVTGDDVLEASPRHMKISSASFRRAMKRADERKSVFAFVHSHPAGHPNHSEQDDQEEASLFRTAHVRVHTGGAHASLVFMDGGVTAARVWLPDGTTAPIERVRIIGRRVRFWFPDRHDEALPDFFDRQVRAFGPDIQSLLRRLRVGVVGVGGTGSAVTEQLVRLGVGELLVSDGEDFEPSNVNRVYGSRVIDATIPKVKLAERSAANIGLNTKIRVLPRPITFASIIEQLRECDLIFGCTDDEWGRSLLTRLAVYYAIPVFDMGVKIDSQGGVIRSIQGRVTSLLPGAACLFCRNRISADAVRVQSIRTLNPEEAAQLEREGYIPELGDPAPAVIPFTTAIAASAVSEFLHRLTGFMGDDRETTELIHLMDDTSIRRNNKPANPECFCAEPSYWCRGDVRPLLDVTWRPE